MGRYMEPPRPEDATTIVYRDSHIEVRYTYGLAQVVQHNRFTTPEEMIDSMGLANKALKKFLRKQRKGKT